MEGGNLDSPNQESPPFSSRLACSTAIVIAFGALGLPRPYYPISWHPRRPRVSYSHSCVPARRDIFFPLFGHVGATLSTTPSPFCGLSSFRLGIIYIHTAPGESHSYAYCCRSSNALETLRSNLIFGFKGSLAPMEDSSSLLTKPALVAEPQDAKKLKLTTEDSRKAAQYFEEVFLGVNQPTNQHLDLT